jgi:NADH-quinone oxidoreductase subunit G
MDKNITVTIESAVEVFRGAKSILFNSSISNEEAMILQKLKERCGYKLISASAKSYQDFLNAYSSITGRLLYSGDLKKIGESEAIIVLGTRINDDNLQVEYHINMASREHQAKVIYMHPIEDSKLGEIITQFIKYEVGSEEGVVALLVEILLRDIKLPQHIKEILEDLDIGNLSAESNVGEEELEALAKSLIKMREISLIIGSDLYTHPRAINIAKLLALLEKYAGFSILFVPPEENTLGVSLICELDNQVESPTVEYISLQQEGTATTIDKKVAPTDITPSYSSYTLNDIANLLLVEKGVESERFDDLGDEFRGYLLTPTEVEVNEQIEEPEEMEEFDGAVIYNCNSSTIDTPALVGSQQFAIATKLKDGDRIEFTLDGVKFSRLFKIDTSMKGTVALNPTYDMGLRASLLFSYRFSRLEFKKVGMEK